MTPPAGNTFGDIPNPEQALAKVAVVPAYSFPEARGSAFDSPRAIIRASAYLELYDEELNAQPSDLGLHTLTEALTVGLGDRAPFEKTLAGLIGAGLFPALIGDSRAVSAAALEAAWRIDPGIEPILLTGSIPAWEDLPRVPCTLKVLGLKSPPRDLPAGLSLLASARQIWAGAGLWEKTAEKAWLSIHPDFLEPAVLQAGYNLEPGGLDWWRTSHTLKALFASCRVVGLDLSGHRPEEGKVTADFTLAKLFYKLIGYRLFAGSH